MNMPRFNAEASLGPSMNTYRRRASYSESGAMQVTPSQIWGVRHFSIDAMLRLCDVAGKIRMHLTAHSSVAKLRMQTHV